MTVGLSLAAGSLFTVDKVSKVYVRTFITLQPNVCGGKLPSRADMVRLTQVYYNLDLIFIALAIISNSYEHCAHHVNCSDLET